MIFPFVFLPIGYDYSIFMLGGKAITNGGKLYVDFIDVKPPLLYYIFALMYLLFKKNIILYQVANAFLLLLTSLAISKISSYIFDKKWPIYFSPIPFILFCSAFNYNYIFQPEFLFAFTFGAATILIFQRPDSIFNAIAAGILSGIAFGFKYSFGIVIVPIIIYYFLSIQPYKKLNVVGLFLLSFVVTSLVPYLILYFQNGTLKDYFHILDFLIYYQGTADLSEKSIKRIINALEIIIGVHYSLLFSIGFFYGVWKILIHEFNTINKVNKYHTYLLVSFLFIFFSLAVERQFLNYHFIRLGVMLSIYTSIGFVFIIEEGKNIPRKLWYILAPVAIFILLFYTPLPRYYRTAIPTVFYFTNKDKFIDFHENPKTAHTLHRQHTSIANFLNKYINEKDTVIIIGGATHIYTLLKDCYYSAFPSSVFVLSKYDKPKEWEDRFIKELKNAKFLIIQDFDHTHFFGQEKSSWELFNENKIYKKILDDRFHLIWKTFSFYVFQRRN